MIDFQEENPGELPPPEEPINQELTTEKIRGKTKNRIMAAMACIVFAASGILAGIVLEKNYEIADKIEDIIYFRNKSEEEIRTILNNRFNEHVKLLDCMYGKGYEASHKKSQ